MQITIKIKPRRELFYNEEQAFGIYGADVHEDDLHYFDGNGDYKLNQYDNISFKGKMPKLEMGFIYHASISLDKGAKYEGSYILNDIRQERPTTLPEQKDFLKMILTDYQIRNIYKTYDENDDIVGLIEKDEFDWQKVHGLGEKTYEKLKDTVMKNLAMSEILSFLSKYGIKYNMIKKLLKEFKNPQIVIQRIESNPYILTKVKGIGFKTADEIAKAVGYDMKSPNRIEACLHFVVGQEHGNGHSWVNFKTLLKGTQELLNLPKSLIEKQMGRSTLVKVGEDKYTTQRVYDAEMYVAMRLIEMKSSSTKVFEAEEIDLFLDDYCSKHGVELEENQRKFFHDWNENRALLLIGGGGMGKSWLQKILLELIAKKSYTTALLAPTGRASKVMSNYTGKPASTIHRKAGVFEEDGEANGIIEEDIIIVDEASMCDVFILAKLFKAMKNTNARILFVGDDFQLPSVGVGNFLYDCINSGIIKVSRLKKVFRQADGGILNVVTDIREGKKFLNPTDEGRKQFGKDCVFWLVDSDYIFDGIILNYKNCLKRFKQEDIAILSPSNKGKLGTMAINKAIQEIANPESEDKKEKEFKDENKTIFRVGDMVMNTVNTYKMETVKEGQVVDVFNGDCGKIVDIDEEEKMFIINVEGFHVKMKFESILSNLVHAWCITIHKSQGSQYDTVISVFDSSMTYQLNANLMYTGGSRAKKFLLVFSQAKTINKCMSKFANMDRRSFLQDFLDIFNGNKRFLEEMKASQPEPPNIEDDDVTLIFDKYEE